MNSENPENLPTLTQDSVRVMSCSALVDFLISETFDEAVFIFISAISCYGVTDRWDAVAVMEKDRDTRKWAESTALMIPEPYEQNKRLP